MAKCRSLPQRWVILLQCTCVLIFSYAIRLNFSVAIVCMVKAAPRINHTAHGLSNHSLNTHYDVDVTQASCENDTVLDRGYSSANTDRRNETGEFEWSKKTQGDLLAAASYGYISTQILAGWLTRRYGAKMVLGLCLLGMNICCLVTPMAARWGVYFLFSVRVLLGMFLAATIPGVYHLISRWAAPLERSLMLSIASSGFAVGEVLSFSVSGFLCEYGFDGGWPSIFYVFGGVSMLWLLTWPITVYDTPNAHPRISKKERVYLDSVLQTGTKKDKDIRTPWISILTSAPFWGCTMGYVASDWVNNTLQLGLILYMKEVLHYNMSENGLLSSLPSVGNFLMLFVAGYSADLLQKKRLMNTVNTRRFFQLVSCLPMGVFIIATGFVNVENRIWAVVFLTIARVFFAFSRGGYPVNPLDFAPRYCSEMVGVMNTIGTVTGFVSPLATAALTPNGTRLEWLNVFCISGGMSIGGALGFCVLARGEVQKWAVVEEHEEEVKDTLVNVENVPV